MRYQKHQFEIPFLRRASICGQCSLWRDGQLEHSIAEIIKMIFLVNYHVIDESISRSGSTGILVLETGSDKSLCQRDVGHESNTLPPVHLPCLKVLPLV